jgi:hypothetical protein
VALLLLSSPAFAQSSSKASAEALFEEGRRLMTAGQAADACPKFADSNKLDPSSGTLLNLGACYEKVGRTASAWAAYQEAASVAQSSGRQDHLQIAQKRASGLAPTLSHVVVTVTDPPAGIQVRRDGVSVVNAEWGLAVPIDAGSHAYEASAPGYRTWKGSLDVGGDGAKATMVIPALEKLPADVPHDPPPETPTSSSWRPLRTVALVSGGVGVVGLVLGTVFGLKASSTYDASLANCRAAPADKNLCTPAGVSERDSAILQGNVATVGFVVGGVALAAGVVLWIVAPAPKETKSARLWIAPTLDGAMMRGEW